MALSPMEAVRRVFGGRKSAEPRGFCGFDRGER